MKKRNTTNKYYDFLGFSIGAVAELEEDCDDIIRGAYPEIMDKMGLKKDNPLNPISPHWNIGEVEKLRFYPLNSSLPLIIQLKLRCKELNFILKKLQDSLLEKMKNENTLSLGDKAQIIKRNKSEAEILEIKLMEESGLIRLEDGKFIPKEVYDRMNGVALIDNEESRLSLSLRGGTPTKQSRTKTKAVFATKFSVFARYSEAILSEIATVVRSTKLLRNDRW
ncbi:MAG: hypothetical protein GX765_06085 [Candidatus Moranbacteria bacterium]|nr:hypothetical protein [Candidatus Moranbacteria bacterium]